MKNSQEINKLPKYKSMIKRISRPNNDYSDFVEYLEKTLNIQRNIIKQVNLLIHKEDLTFITEDWLLESIQNRGIENLVFKRMITSAYEYLKNNKNQKIFEGTFKSKRSFQLSNADFFKMRIQNQEYSDIIKESRKFSPVFKFISSQIKPFYIENLPVNFADSIKHMIVRPCIFKGQIQPTQWEALLIPEYKGYIIDNIDN